MNACKHLDHNEANYPSCTLITLENFSVQVKHWRRNDVPYTGAPVNVQFCGQGRGRINGIFQCYNEGEMSCYEPAEDSGPNGECPICGGIECKPGCRDGTDGPL